MIIRFYGNDKLYASIRSEQQTNGVMLNVEITIRNDVEYKITQNIKMKENVQ